MSVENTYSSASSTLVLGNNERTCVRVQYKLLATFNYVNFVCIASSLLLYGMAEYRTQSHTVLYCTVPAAYFTHKLRVCTIYRDVDQVRNAR